MSDCDKNAGTQYLSKFSIKYCVPGILLFFVALVAPDAIAAEAPSVMQQALTLLQKKNSSIGKITFLQLMPFYGRNTRYLLLVHGIRADVRFSGDFNDELFGLFVVDQSFERVLRVIDIIPTRRWNDYSVEIKLGGDGSILAVCKGATYGDQPVIKRYSTDLIYEESISPPK